MNTYEHIPGIKGLVSTDIAHWSPQLERACKEANVSTIKVYEDGRVVRVCGSDLQGILQRFTDEEGNPVGALNLDEWVRRMQHLRKNSPNRFETEKNKTPPAVLDMSYHPIDKENGILVYSPSRKRESRKVPILIHDLERQLREKGIELEYPESPNPKYNYSLVGDACRWPYDKNPTLSIELDGFTGLQGLNDTSFIPVKLPKARH